MNNERVLKMLLILMICVAALVATFAYAGEIVIEGTPPTQREDGTALTPVEIAGYRIEWGTCSGTQFGTRISDVIATAFPYTITGLAAGDYCIRAYTRTTDGLESQPTNVVTKTLLPSRPLPPNPLYAREGVVYQVVGTKDRFAFLAVGTVPADTSCDATQTVNAYNGVPRAAVTWYGNVRPQIVVARCSE